MEFRGPRDRHPSGRPIRRDNRRSYEDGYRNLESFRTLRLRQDRNTHAVGFFANLTSEIDEE